MCKCRYHHSQGNYSAHKATLQKKRTQQSYGFARKQLHGHDAFVVGKPNSQPEQRKPAVPSLNGVQLPPPPFAGHGSIAQGVAVNETNNAPPPSPKTAYLGTMRWLLQDRRHRRNTGRQLCRRSTQCNCRHRCWQSTDSSRKASL